MSFEKKSKNIFWNYKFLKFRLGVGRKLRHKIWTFFDPLPTSLRFLLLRLSQYPWSLPLLDRDVIYGRTLFWNLKAMIKRHTSPCRLDISIQEKEKQHFISDFKHTLSNKEKLISTPKSVFLCVCVQIPKI